jgi:hypothetical protein
VDKIDEDEKIRNIEPPILNGKLLKQLASGGDKIELRQNYENEGEFKIGCKIFINSNDLINMTTTDEKEDSIIIEYRSKVVEQYKEKESIEGCEIANIKVKRILNFRYHKKR